MDDSIKKSGFRYNKAHGEFQGKQEVSFVVYADGKLSKLESLALKWCKKYNQKCILVIKDGKKIFKNYKGEIIPPQKGKTTL